MTSRDRANARALAVTAWPAVVAVLVLWAIVGAATWSAIRHSEGHFLYSLDDAYIHMAVARNFVVHGVWGVTRYGFSSSTSSLLWPALLVVVDIVFGINALTPLVLNVVFATATIVFAHRILERFRLRAPYILVILLGVVMLTPLPVLVMSGMEHILHILVTLAFAYVAVRALAPDAKPSRGQLVLLLVLAPLVILSRYEGLAAVAVVSVLFLFRRRWGLALLLGALGSVPICVYGVVSIQHGWFFLPNPILRKAVVPDLSGFRGAVRMLGLQSLERILETPHVFTLLVAALLACVRSFDRHGWWQDGKLMVLIFVTTAVAHMQFGGVGWLFRYEAYLMALGLVATAVNLPELQADWDAKRRPAGMSAKTVAVVCLVILLAAPILSRGWRATREMGDGPYFYRTTYQMSRFVHAWYQGEPVVINDIGAVNYYADCRCLDVVGLGTVEVLQGPRGEPYHVLIDRLAQAKGVKVAIFSIWFPQRYAAEIPPHWRRVGAWTVDGPTGRPWSRDEIWFYATDARWEDSVGEAFERFTPQLPRSVQATSSRAAETGGGPSAKK